MDFAKLPRIDKVVEKAQGLLATPEPVISVLTDCAREAVDALRRHIVPVPEDAGREELMLMATEDTVRRYREMTQPSLYSVINATGVVLHTNLGRSPLSHQAALAAYEAAAGYCNVELDSETGERGDRYTHVRSLLCELTDAEDALVVNNNAAAVMVILDTLAKGGEAVISRGQLVEIGGGFRMPEVIAGTGALLHEVGTTNKTHPEDYENAICENTRCILQVHPSNYFMRGFVESVPVDRLAEIAHNRGLPLIYDLGSGALYPFASRGIGSEPVPRDLISMGVDVLSFSGDKLLGGPQAGIIVGAGKLLACIRKNPLMRAIRVGKMTLAALQATLLMYRTGLETQIPVISMLTADEAVLDRRMERLRGLLGDCDAEMNVRRGVSPVGGGAMPDAQLPTCILEVSSRKIGTADMLRKLRLGKPAILAYNRAERACFDVRTVSDDEIVQLAAALREALK